MVVFEITAAGAAYFIVADKTVLASARKNSFERAQLSNIEAWHLAVFLVWASPPNLSPSPCNHLFLLVIQLLYKKTGLLSCALALLGKWTYGLECMLLFFFSVLAFSILLSFLFFFLQETNVWCHCSNQGWNLYLFYVFFFWAQTWLHCASTVHFRCSFASLSYNVGLVSTMGHWRPIVSIVSCTGIGQKLIPIVSINDT